MKTTPVIVIGAGIGGITAAIHLAKKGLRVIIIEKNARPGGRCDQISREGHHFDTGPTLLVMPLLYASEFAAMGTEMREVLDLQRVDPSYHLVFDDGSQLALTSDMQALKNQLEQIETGSFQGLQRYLEYVNRHYHVSLEKLVEPDFRKASDFFKLGNLPLLYQVKPLINHYANMANYFNDPRLRPFIPRCLYGIEAPSRLRQHFDDALHRQRGVWYQRRACTRLSGRSPSWHNRRALNSSSIRQSSGSMSMENGRGLSWQMVNLCLPSSLANVDLPFVYQDAFPAGRVYEQISP
jgi:phytoene desaturase